MKFWAGFDVGKAFHWLCVLDGEGERVLSRRVEATEEEIGEALEELARLGDDTVFGLDMAGGPATLLASMLLERGERVLFVPGMAVNRSREAYSGGERKSDPGDARVIADQLQVRSQRAEARATQGRGARRA